MDQGSDVLNLVLQALQENDQLSSQAFSTSKGLNHQDLVGYLNKLSSERYVLLKNEQSKVFVLTPEGHDYHTNGTPEYNLLLKVPAEGISIDALQKLVGESFNIARSNALSKKYVKIEAGLIKRNDAKPNPVDEDRQALVQTLAGTPTDLANLKKRKLVKEDTVTTFIVTKGPNYQPQFVKPAADITVQMLRTGSWNTTNFKSFNFAAKGKPATYGNLHPLMKVKKQFASILQNLGFQEMQTNQYVESSFWNFDALYTPQKHPAREAQDTFFVSNPAHGSVGDSNVWKKVQQVHERGSEESGSRGYGCEWAEEDSRKLVFRTHTTAVSSKVLYRVAQEYREKGYTPRKYYSIDRVFRNETLDATHLAEFHQIEGFVIDKNASLASLMGVIRAFFSKVGITDIKFKPTYNPYTEPSLEIYGFHPQLKKLVEIGNSGIFRPELLIPLGFDKDIRVIAWGLSLERPMMIQYQVSDIRDIIGHEVQIDTVRKNPFCLLG